MSKKDSKKHIDKKKKKNRDRIGYQHVEIEVDALRDILEKRKANIKHSQTTKDDETPPEKKKKK